MSVGANCSRVSQNHSENRSQLEELLEGYAVDALTSVRDISRETGLSQTQSFSALDYLVTLGEVEVRRQNRTPTVLYRIPIQTS